MQRVQEMLLIANMENTWKETNTKYIKHDENRQRNEQNREYLQTIFEKLLWPQCQTESQNTLAANQQ